MLSTVLSASVFGIDGFIIKVEVDVSNRGLPNLTIVGLPDKSVEEAKERVKSAIRNSSLTMPENRIIINLAPADIYKEGSGFDLPIALGILAANDNFDKNIFLESIFIGELALNGDVRGVKGALPIILKAKEVGIKNIFLPKENFYYDFQINNVNIFPVTNLKQLLLHLYKEIEISPYIVSKQEEDISNKFIETDFYDIRGQFKAKRAMEIAAAGFHNLYLKGTPGVGKTMLSKAFVSILPEMDNDEFLEVSKIYSIVNKNQYFSKIRPFRSPHHTASKIGLIGGGAKLIPGEITLAHRGVLFLDEFSEFPRNLLEALRQPLEDGYVNISRATGNYSFPCRFQLIAAANPCPCGYLGHSKKTCICSYSQIEKYKKRISGPILDRIDLHIEVHNISESDLNIEKNEKSEVIKKRVENARKIQLLRFKDEKIKTNSEMSVNNIKKYCLFEDSALFLIKKSISKFNFSTRSYFKIIKIAQTICDLDKQIKINEKHVLEALQYRPLID